MDYVLDKKIALNENTEHSSLYKWCLNEYDTNGNKVGRDLIPWSFSLYFMGSSLKLVNEVYFETEYDDNFVETKEDKAQARVVVVGIFHPGLCRDGTYLTDDVSYSMFGTNRKIKEFEVRIKQSGDGKEECKVYGSPSYEYELDFSDEIAPDYVQLELTLCDEKFNKIIKSVEDKSIESAVLRIGRVKGFYSDWSPSISTSFVKILTRSHEVATTENSNIDFPVLGSVGEFSLSFTSVNNLNVKPISLSFDVDKAFEEPEQNLSSEEPVVEKFNVNQVSNSATTDKLINKLKTPLWCIFGMLVLLLFK